MAQAEAPAATAANAVVAFTEYSGCKGYRIIVPKQFSTKDSKLLMKLQVSAIDAHAVSGVERDTIVNTAAWTTEGQPCVHINFCPVSRDDFNYPAFCPLSLVEKCGRIVAGVCVVSLGQCRQLAQRSKHLSLDLDNNLGLLLERLWPGRNTNLVHDDRQVRAINMRFESLEDTSNPSPSTTSAICSQSTLTTTTEARKDNLGVITRRRRRNSNDCAAEAPEPKRAYTAPTFRLSSESVFRKPTSSSTSTVPDRDIIHAPTAEIGNLTPLPASTSKADMMVCLGLDNKIHGLLLKEAYQARDFIYQSLGHLSWKDVPVEVRQKATLEMVKNASKETKPYYEKGRWCNNGIEENWVAWWYIYSCFRYKSNRQARLNKARATLTQDAVRGGYKPSIEDIQGRGKGNLEWRDIQTPSRPTITSSSIPTSVPDLGMNPGLSLESSVDMQCGNSIFPEFQQNSIDPMSLELWNRVLEYDCLSGYPY